MFFTLRLGLLLIFLQTLLHNLFKFRFHYFRIVFMKLIKKKPITSGSCHQININKNVLSKSLNIIKKLVFNIHKNVGRSSLTGHITVRAKPFAVVFIRKFSTYKSVVYIPAGLRKLIENPGFQFGLLLLLLGSYYFYYFGIVFVIPIVVMHALFFSFLGFHFFIIKPLSFYNEKSAWVFPIFSVIYGIFSLFAAVYFQSLIRLCVVLFFFLFLVYKILPPTAPIREKLLPLSVVRFVESNLRDNKTLENHLREDLPFLFTVRSAFRLHSLLVYVGFVVWSIDPTFLGLTGESVGYLVFSNSITLLFIWAFTQYILCCCNTPPENFIISTTKLAVLGGVAFVAGQLTLGANEETSAIAMLPASVKYYQQDSLQASVTVDRFDRQVLQIQKDLTAAGVLIPYGDSMDPDYPMRYDAKAYIDAMEAHKKNASVEEVKRILTRNSKAADRTVEMNSYKSSYQIIMEAVPKRKNMLESCAESDARALRNAPDPTGNYFPSLVRWTKKS